MKNNETITIATKQVAKFKSFNYWFIRSFDTNKTQNVFIIVDMITKEPVGKLVEDMYKHEYSVISDDEKCGLFEDDIKEDFEQYKHRPEYLVGHSMFCSFNNLIIDLDKKEGGIDRDLDMQNFYLTLLVGCALCRAYRNIDDVDDAILKAMKCTMWLERTDFFNAPASTRYHESFKGGLAEHSLRCVGKAYELLSTDIFPGVRYEDITLVGLVHDWCKIGFYESYQKNVKDDKTGQWHKEEAYKLKDKSMSCLGHGVSSLFLAQKFFSLTVAEACAIRWHMGWCRVAESEANELQQANEVYPIVHLLQFADQLSITDYR